jgi:apolipoprotein D and lipocalin family protein
VFPERKDMDEQRQEQDLMFSDAPTTAPHVDLGRYLGRWFEIARLPNRRQAEDCTDVSADYAPTDDGLQVVQRCIDVGGDRRSDEGVLTVTGRDSAKLSISFLPERLRWLPFARRDYWILRLDPEYTMSLIGSRNRRRLWLLARHRQPDPAMRDEFLAHAERLGYDLTALIHTPQASSQDARRTVDISDLAPPAPQSSSADSRCIPPGVDATSSHAAVSASGSPRMSAGRYFIWNVLMTSRVAPSSSPCAGTR